MSTVAQRLFTTVTNSSPSTLSFSYLPPHGKTLAPGQTISIRGDLVAQLGALSNRRKFTALQADMTSGRLTVVKPAVT